MSRAAERPSRPERRGSSLHKQQAAAIVSKFWANAQIRKARGRADAIAADLSLSGERPKYRLNFETALM
jgi:hypothetical protein